MPKKGKKRREAQRLRKQERVGTEHETLSPEEEAARLARARVKAEHEAERLRRKRKAAAGEGFPVNPWYIGTPIVVILVAIGAYFAFSGGGGGDSTPSPSATVDPRIRDLTPTATLNVEAGGDADNAFFTPNRITASAGEAFEILVPNTGTVTHNLTIAGVDGEYDTKDDWESNPYDIKVGEQGRLVVTLDEPGSYAFRCAFHPTVQFGTLVVQ